MTPDEEAILKELQARLEKLEAENAQLRAENKRLAEENQQLRQHIERLEGELSVVDGPNTPPGSQPPFRKKESRAERKASSRKKRGRKNGHKGSTLMIVPDRTVKDIMSTCYYCHLPLAGATHVYSYNVLEIKQPIETEVIRHDVHRSICQHCGTVNEPEKVLGQTMVGPKLASMFSLLWYRGRTPLLGLSEIFKALSGQALSASSIYQCLSAVSNKLEEPVAAIRQQVIEAPVVHMDETSYVSNVDERKLDWLWSFSTSNAAYYQFQDDRSGSILKDLWGDDPGGVIAIVDGWTAYNYFEKKQRCWAHILRESEDLAKRRKAEAIPLDEELRKVFHKVKRTHLLQKGSATIRRKSALQLEQAITVASRSSDPKICKFAAKLQRGVMDLLLAVEMPSLPLTNNQAERMLRPLVINRKIRGFVASEQGKLNLSRFATMFETWKLNGTNPHQALLEILEAAS